MKDYYPIKIKKDGKLYFCIWYTNDVDGIVLENGKIKSFSNFEDLNAYCGKKKININNDISTYSMDKVLKWLSSYEQNVDCKFILDLWNLISDLARSVDEYFYGDDDDALDIYRKLFYGNNLPAINRSGNTYHPQWNNDEYEDIKKIIKSGLNLFNKYL